MDWLSLEQLRRQREQVKSHLDWLDAAIHDLEEARKQQVRQAVERDPSQPVDPAVVMPTLFFPSEDRRQGETMSWATGCWITAIIGMLIVLFIFFVLPMWLYDPPAWLPEWLRFPGSGGE